MNRKKISALLVAAMISVSIVGCGNEVSKNSETNTKNSSVEEKQEDNDGKVQEDKKVEGGNFIIGVRDDTRVMNPLYADDRTTLMLVNNMFSTLYDSENGGNYYKLAESVEVSEDFMTYTLRLKDDLKWHDGEKIDADDVIFTMNTILDEKQGAKQIDDFTTPAGSVSYEKIDDLTVKFTLPELNISFEGTLGGLRLMPEHVYSGIDDLQNHEINNNPVGSGPYKFETRAAGESITLARFDDYCLGKGNLEKAIFRILPDNNSADAAFKNGEIDVKYIYPEDVSKFKEEGYNVLAFDEDQMSYVFMNHNMPIIQNKNIRQAICYAINREEVILGNFYSEEYAPPAKSFMAQNTQFINNDVNAYDYNPEKAKELIKESGVTDFKIKIALLGKGDAQGLLIQKYLEEVGFEVELKVMDSGAFYNILFNPAENKEFDLAINGYIYGTDPASYAQVFKADSPNNMASYKNTEVDKLWDQASVELDEAKREALYTEIQEKIIEDAALYPLYYRYALVAVNPKFKGLEEAKPAAIYMFDDLSKIYMTE